MIENRTVLKVVKGERTYELQCSPDSPLGELFDVACDFKGFIYEKLQESIKNEEEVRANKQQEEIKLVEPEIV